MVLLSFLIKKELCIRLFFKNKTLFFVTLIIAQKINYDDFSDKKVHMFILSNEYFSYISQ